MTIEADGVLTDPAPAGRIRRGLCAAADQICRAVDLVLGLGMIAAVALNFANVLGRYVFGYALVGADELLIYGMIATIFLGAVSVTWKDAHLKLDVMVAAMPPSVQAGARAASQLALAALCGTVAYAAGHMAYEMWHFDQRSLAAGLPMVLPHGAVALGMALMAVMALLRAAGFAPGGQTDDPLAIETPGSAP
jgi:TRAP-type C4-dicarboxylate transport system permease small subunit